MNPHEPSLVELQKKLDRIRTKQARLILNWAINSPEEISPSDIPELLDKQAKLLFAEVGDGVLALLIEDYQAK